MVRQAPRAIDEEHRDLKILVVSGGLQFGGEVIQTSLDDEAETRLREVLERREAAVGPAT